MRSVNKRIILDYSWIILFVFLGKSTSVMKEMSVAWRYGSDVTVDSFTFLFSLLIWPVSIWLSILNLALVPIITQMRFNNNQELKKFQQEFFGMSLILGVIICLFTWIVIKFFIMHGWIDFGEAVNAELALMIDGLVFLIPFGILSCYFSAWLLAYKSHSNTVLDAIPAIVIFAFILLPGDIISEPLVYGTVWGYFFYLVAISYVHHLKIGFAFPRFNFNSIAWKSFISGFGVLVIVQIITSVTFIIDQFYAGTLGQDSLSILGYANRILTIVFSISSLAIARACLPVFAEVAASEPEKLGEIAIRWSIYVFIVGLVVVVVGYFLAHTIVSVLYERGAFLPDDTDKVADVLKCALTQIPFFTTVLLLTNYLSSKRHYTLLLAGTLVGLVVKIPAAIFFVRYYNLNGLLVSTSFVYACSLFVLVFFIIKFEKSN